MPNAPILIKCDCGTETRGQAGMKITCSGCGLAFDTTGEAKTLGMIAAATQKQFRYLSRAGIGFLGLLGLAGLALFGVPGLVVGAALGGAAWYAGLMPIAKRRLLEKATSKYTPTITASRK